MHEGRRRVADLILMDMHLPVMDGWEATRQIKANSALNAIPIIALTADAMPGDREKAIDAGCDHVRRHDAGNGWLERDQCDQSR